MRNLISVTVVLLLAGCSTYFMQIAREYRGSEVVKVATKNGYYTVQQHPRDETRVLVKERDNFGDGFAFFMLAQDGNGPMEAYESALRPWLASKQRECEITDRDLIPHAGAEFRLRCRASD